MKRYRRLLVFLILTAAWTLSGCGALSPAPPSAPNIPGLSGTLAAQTLTARDGSAASLWKTPEPLKADNPLTAMHFAPTPMAQPLEPVAPLASQPVVPTSPSAAEGECTNQAQFVEDVSVPDWTKMKAGERFVKTWRFQNAGTCTWTPEYTLSFVWGDNLAGYDTKYLGATVKPEEFINVSLELTAPQETSYYQGNWMFMDTDGNRFGTGYKGRQFFWVAIAVGNPGGGLNIGGGFGGEVTGGICKGGG